MNPMTVKLFHTNSRKIKHRFLDMCTTHGGTAEEIFQKMNNVIVQNQINWKHCIGLSVDNTAASMGIRNGLKVKILHENEKIYVMGCPYHIINDIGLAGSKAFVSECGFDINDFAVDNYYWLDKSTNRKNLLQDFCDFVDIKYRTILDHISVRWLSLEKVNDRHLSQSPALESYYLSESHPQVQRSNDRSILAVLSSCSASIYQFQSHFTTRRTMYSPHRRRND